MRTLEVLGYIALLVLSFQALQYEFNFTKKIR